MNTAVETYCRDISACEFEQPPGYKRRPLILFFGFYRSGTTWLKEVLEGGTRGITEPFGYFFVKNPGEPRTNLTSYNEELFVQVLRAWSDNTRNAVPPLIKETEIGPNFDFFLNLLPEDTRVLLAKRDPRGIVASFKRGGLFDKWNMGQVFSTIAENREYYEQKTGKSYQLLIEKGLKGSWIEKLLGIYVISMDVVERALEERGDLVVVYQYEELVRQLMESDTSKLVTMLRRLGIDSIDKVLVRIKAFNSSEEPEADENPHAIFKKKVDPYAWVSILAPDEIELIARILEENGRGKDLQEVPNGWQPKSYDHKRVTAKVENELVLPRFGSREEVINQIWNQSIVFENGGETFGMTKYHITNEQMAYFLNWLIKKGFNIHGDKPNMLINDASLGHLHFQDGKWYVDKGFEDHPATYCTHMALNLFASWCGGRLPTKFEWEVAAKESGDLNQPPNFGGRVGKVEKVGFSTHENGMADLFGNVRDWTSWIDTSTFEAVGKGGSFKDTCDRIGVGFDYPRPIFLGSSSMGARIVLEKPVEEEDWLRRFKIAWNMLNKRKALERLGISGLLQKFYNLIDIRNIESTLPASRIIATPRVDMSFDEAIEFIKNGVDEFRITLSSKERRDNALRLISVIDEARKKLGKPITIMVDLPGPKIRVQGLEFLYGKRRIVLEDGEECVFAIREIPDVDIINGSKARERLFLIDLLPQDIRTGSRFYVSDGYRTFEVIESGEGWIRAKAIGKTPVNEGRGVNFPAQLDNLCGFTGKDRDWLRSVPPEIREKIDKIAISFVNHPDDIKAAREFLEKNRYGHVKLVSKIETIAGLNNSKKIALLSDEVMIARGDLAVELRGDPGGRSLEVAEQEIIKACEEVSVPFIIATRVGESFVNGEGELSEEEILTIRKEVEDGPTTFMFSGEINSFPHETGISNLQKLTQAIANEEA